MRLMIIQYGNYLEALIAREKGLPENYRAQYSSLDVIDNLVNKNPCTIVCVGDYSNDLTMYEYRELKKKINKNNKITDDIKIYTYKNYEIIYGDFTPQIKNVLQQKICLKYKDKIANYINYHQQVYSIVKSIKKIALDFAPTHMIIRTTGWLLGNIGSWAINNNIYLLPVLADYEERKHGFRALFTPRHIKVLQSTKVPLVCNHNYPASESLVRAGVSAAKVVPWDWPHARHPAMAKKHRKSLQGGGIYRAIKSDYNSDKQHIKLLYAGLLRFDKGVGDILTALHLLQNENVYADNNLFFSLTICGDGPDIKRLKLLAKSLGLSEMVNNNHTVYFCGKISNKEVQTYMEQADIVIVPSWHSYPEGMPNVIYEAFEAYTPIIISDHPSFTKILVDGQGCTIVKEKKAEEIASALLTMSQRAQYKSICNGIIESWEKIQSPVLFSDVIMQWKMYTEKNIPIECFKYSLDNNKVQ